MKKNKNKRQETETKEKGERTEINSVVATNGCTLEYTNRKYADVSEE